MRITAYSFGSITIDGKKFEKDVIIGPDGVLSPWWRAEGHRLTPADLDDVVKSAPSILVIGTGAMGVMKVPGETVEYLRGKGIEARVMRTGRAVEEFNSLEGELGPSGVMAALHLTC